MTPMMRQYLEMKERYKDCVLFYRLGDFYEMFFDDALMVSKELELTLTGRDCGLEERAPMCGVPYHAAATYISRLVESGHKVAICEQTSDPATSKGLVERDVVRVITPGTVVDPMMLNERMANYVLCVAFKGKAVSLAYADVSTGELVAHQLLNPANRLRDELTRISAQEIITNQKEELESYLNAAVSISEMPDSVFTPGNATKMVISHFKVQNVNSLGLDARDIRIIATGALLSYLKDTQKNSLSHITKLTLYQDVRTMTLDRSTRKNLELTESLRYGEKKGSLLWLLDKTQTAMGGRLLRNWVENPLILQSAIEERLDGVEALYSELMVAQELADALSNVADMERLVGKISYGSITPRDCIALLRSLKQVSPLKVLISNVKSVAIAIIERTLTPLKTLTELLESALNPDAPIALSDGNIINSGYNQQLDEYRIAATNGKQWILNMEANERQNTGIKNLKIHYNRVFGFYIEVTKSNLGLVPPYYVRKQTLANCERYITADLQEIEKKISTAEQSILALETQLFMQIREEIGKEIGAIQQNALSIKTLDALLSLANVARENDFIKPNINDEGVYEVIDGRHPIVENMLKDETFVPNDVYLDASDNRMLIITGPNMSGKSTYMRQVALFTIMMQIGSFVPARTANLCICDRVFTRIGAQDDLASGQSTFMVEMSETAGILRNATEKSLIILDEIGRGTSTFDGLAIAWAVVEFLLNNKKGGPKTLFATHYHELSELEGHLEGVKNYCISVAEHGEEVIFLRKIIPGGADKSYGVHVARIAGIPPKVVARAKEIQTRLEVSDINQGSISANILEKKEKPVKQLDMFHIEQDALIHEIQEMNVYDITPMDALNMLFQIREKARKL